MTIELARGEKTTRDAKKAKNQTKGLEGPALFNVATTAVLVEDSQCAKIKDDLRGVTCSQSSKNVLCPRGSCRT